MRVRLVLDVKDCYYLAAEYHFCGSCKGTLLFSLGCAWCTTTLRETCSPLSSFVGSHFIIQLASVNCKKHELAERNFIFAQHCQSNESNPAEKHSPSMRT